MKTRRKQRTLLIVTKHDVISPTLTRVIAHAPNPLHCHDAPVYLMIDLQQIDLQLLFVPIVACVNTVDLCFVF